MGRVVSAIAVLFTMACAVSDEQELQLGSELAAEIEQQLPLVRDPELTGYVTSLGETLARGADERDITWRFTIVDAEPVNAFAIPGGHIYVNRGLIERTTQMSELAGVLGHEIGHVVRRHSIQQMEKAQGANVGVTLACILTNICNSQAAQAGINIAGSAVFARFSRQDELEADQEAVTNTIRARISPQGIVTMFQKLMAERRSRPSAVEGWFATHPMEEDRIQQAQQIINSIPASQRTGLSTNTTNYNSFVARVRSLPAPRQ